MSEPKAYKAKLTDFKPDKNNLNRHTQHGQRLVENSQRNRGFARPGFAASDGTILGGNLSVMEVAPDIGLGEGEIFVIESDGDIPIVHLRRDVAPDSEAAALLAAEDNHSALKSINYDPEVLLAEIERGIDFEGIFEVDEIKDILAELGTEESKEDGGGLGEPGAAEKAQEVWGVKEGDVWQLGRHRVICGDCTDRDVVEAVMGGERADMVFTDPPYNVSYQDNETIESLKKRNRRIDGLIIKNDSMTDNEFSEFLIAALENAPISKGDSFYLCAPPGHTETLFRNVLNNVSGWLLKQCIVWVKDQFVFGRQDYHYRHESILYGWVEGSAHYFLDDRTQDTVWEIDRPRISEFHPTTKPIELPARAIKNSCRSGDLIYDPFLGSGTTMAAAHQLNRRCFGIEIDPSYTAVVLERMKNLGVEPELIK